MCSLPGNALPARMMRRSPASGERRRRVLRIAARLHPEHVEYFRLHERFERLVGHIGDQQLHDRVAAARVTVDAAGTDVHAHRRRVCGRLTVEHLHDGRNPGAHGVTGEAMHGESCRVAHQSTQRDLLILRELVVRYTPGLQLRVDVVVQRKLALLDESQRAQCSDRLADRTRLKQRVDSDGCPVDGVAHTVCATPGDLAVVDHRDADAGNAQLQHPLRERRPSSDVLLQGDLWQ